MILKMLNKLVCILIITAVAAFCPSIEFAPEGTTKSTNLGNTKMDKIDGLNFVAPPDEFQGNPMMDVKAVNADWIAVVPFGYTRLGKPSVRYNINWQWWGERLEGAKKTIEMAKESNLKVMLKPQVYIPGSWPGGLDFASDFEWKQWEADYRSFIIDFTKIAVETNTDMICIGTEFKLSAIKRPEFWRGLIKEIRAQYDGKILYASNWDCYQQIPFWEELDYIGVDAYFPLVNEKTPSLNQLKKAWVPITKDLAAFAKKKNKQIIFTEFGYLSIDNCAHQTWELEKKVKKSRINEQAQANALHALFDNFWKEDFWAGGFIWKWFPEGKGHEGYPARDYTPQGKKAEEVLKNWYNEK